MTLAYFDSSALVKLIVDKEGSRDVAVLWDGADAVASSRVAHPEARAALAAAHRAGRLDDAGHDQAKDAWSELHAALRMVELTAEVEEEAARLAEAHALGGFDAIHLASASMLPGAQPIVATWDRRLLQAAKSAGLVTLPTVL